MSDCMELFRAWTSAKSREDEEVTFGRLLSFLDALIGKTFGDISPVIRSSAVWYRGRKDFWHDAFCRHVPMFKVNLCETINAAIQKECNFNANLLNNILELHAFSLAKGADNAAARKHMIISGKGPNQSVLANRRNRVIVQEEANVEERSERHFAAARALAEQIEEDHHDEDEDDLMAGMPLGLRLPASDSHKAPADYIPNSAVLSKSSKKAARSEAAAPAVAKRTRSSSAAAAADSATSSSAKRPRGRPPKSAADECSTSSPAAAPNGRARGRSLGSSSQSAPSQPSRSSRSASASASSRDSASSSVASASKARPVRGGPPLNDLWCIFPYPPSNNGKRAHCAASGCRHQFEIGELALHITSHFVDSAGHRKPSSSVAHFCWNNRCGRNPSPNWDLAPFEGTAVKQLINGAPWQAENDAHRRNLMTAQRVWHWEIVDLE